jgi:diguanylate cyclase (GGDEF)-like protein
VRVAIAMWLVQASVGPLYLSLPGVSQRHAGVVIVCSAIAFAWAAMNLVLPSDPRLTFLYPTGGALAIVIVSVLVASTGGASSPLRASLLFSVVFAAWFMPRTSGRRFLGCAIVATLLPSLYDSHGLEGPQLGWTIMLMLCFLVVGITILAARESIERVRDRARAESLRDPLTGVGNRRALQGHFRRARRQCRESDRLALILIDLDCFKQINTEYGHAGGDRALTAVAHALRELVREGDLLARVGGDEFAIIAANVDTSAAAEIGQRVVRSIIDAGELSELDGFTLGGSAGIAVCPDDGNTLEELLLAADVALTLAKSDGKGRMRCAQPALDGSTSESFQVHALQR